MNSTELYFRITVLSSHSEIKELWTRQIKENGYMKQSVLNPFKPEKNIVILFINPILPVFNTLVKALAQFRNGNTNNELLI